MAKSLNRVEQSDPETTAIQKTTSESERAAGNQQMNQTTCSRPTTGGKNLSLLEAPTASSDIHDSSGSESRSSCSDSDN
jgi:hypothetical protein